MIRHRLTKLSLHSWHLFDKCLYISIIIYIMLLLYIYIKGHSKMYGGGS